LSEGEHSVSYRAVDAAGNEEVGRTETIKVDKTAPAVSVTAPANGADYVLGQAVTVAWTATDGGSGIGSTTATLAAGAPLDTSAAGLKTFGVIAEDNAGNVKAVSVSYRVSVKLEFDIGAKSQDGAVVVAGNSGPFHFTPRDDAGDPIVGLTGRVYVGQVPEGGGQPATWQPAEQADKNIGNLVKSNDGAFRFVLDLRSLDRTKSWWIRIEFSDGSVVVAPLALK
jgi:hypothetical protein